MGEIENVSKELKVIKIKTNENDRTEKTITTIKISLDWLKSRMEMTKHRIMNLRIDQ